MALPVDFDGLKDLAGRCFSTVKNFILDKTKLEWVSDIVAGVVTGIVMMVPLIIAVGIQGIVGIATFFTTKILEVVTAARDNDADDFNEVIAASMSEFLGVDIAGSDLPGGKGPEATAARMRAIGDKLHTLLTQEFGGLREIAPQDGANNARSFTGYAINAAISGAFMSIITEVESLGFLKNFKELGEATIDAMGLGRLQRLAMQPLIRNMIQQPYDLYLRSQTRPDRLTEAQYIHGFHHGDFDETFVRAKLAEKGYPDKEIDRLFLELAAHLAEADILRLIRYGDITQDEGVNELNVQGIPTITAQRLLRATEISRADSIVTSYVNKIESQYLNGFIDLDTFNKLLDQVPWTEEEKKWERNFVGVTLDAPQTTLTLTQVKAGIVGGILDFNYLDRWMLNQGYSDEDQLYLEYEILQALDQKASKDEIAASKAARVAAQSVTPKVAPTITRS